MPKFTCKNCESVTTYMEPDRAYYEAQDWECNRCVVMIPKHRYAKNIPGGLTVFAALGGKELGVALGDHTISEVLERVYREDNPSEQIIYLEPDADHKKAFNRFQPDKFFVSEFTRQDLAGLNLLHQPFVRYRALNDINFLAARGIYPKLRYRPVKPAVELPVDYVVLHVRNIQKNPARPDQGRNMDPVIANSILNHFSTVRIPVVLVGNDEPHDRLGWTQNPFNETDLRGKLRIEETAWVIKHAQAYIGKDAGLVHVAAACNTRIVAWGFLTGKWFPKMRPDRFTALEKADSTRENIYKAIEELAA